MAEQHNCALCGFLIESAQDEVEIDPADLSRRLAAAGVRRRLYGSRRYTHRTTDLCMRAEDAAKEDALYTSATGIGRATQNDRIGRELAEQHLRRLIHPHGHLADDYADYQESDE